MTSVFEALLRVWEFRWFERTATRSRASNKNVTKRKRSLVTRGKVATVRGEDRPQRIRRPIALSVETWEKLSDLAHATTPGRATPTGTSELGAALLEQLVTASK